MILVEVSDICFKSRVARIKARIESRDRKSFM